MTNITSLFARFVLALTLATGAGSAMAVPTSYHINVDTSSLSGDGLFSLSFTGFGTSAANTAITSNFTGNASGAPLLTGAVSGDLASTATFIGGTNEAFLDQLVTFGGWFGLDVIIDSAFLGDVNSFAVQLYNVDYSDLIGANPNVAVIDLSLETGSVFTTNAAFATITVNDAAAVPEPGQWLLMLSGLLLLGAMVRRRSL